MPDPFTTLSLAASIVQFIEFGIKLFGDGKAILAHGSTIRNRDLEAVANDLIRLTMGLEKGRPPSDAAGSNTEDEALYNLASQCSAISKELLSCLKILKVRAGEPRSQWESFHQAIRTIWKHRKIEDMQARLNKFKDAMHSRLLFSLSQKTALHAVQQDERFAALDTTSKLILKKIEEGYAAFTPSLEARFDAIERERCESTSEILCAIKSYHQHDVDKIEATADQKVLDCLHFRHISSRQENVALAHKQTFEWVYRENTKDQPWDNFSQWLKCGEGIYWINGKVGSGKSTLMKFLYNDPQSIDALSVWARGRIILTASFFFWSCGTSIQKSQAGLLRSILHDILHQQPGLIRSVLPDMYKALVRPKPDTSEPTVSELKQGIRNLAAKLPGDVCICCFIDGIDELDGDPVELADFFKSILPYSRIKLVLSSRPIPACVAELGYCPKLRLQDLTAADIKLYIHDRLASHKLMRELNAACPVDTDKLICDISLKADGVFLWVALVVSSLLRGLHNGDSIADLNRRLDLLPSTLEDLYNAMLGKMSALYKSQASQLFQLFRARMPNDLFALELSFAGDGPCFAAEAPTGNMSTSEQNSRCKAIENCLRSRCCGLLEIHNSGVSYLHRSVAEFLYSPDVWLRILSETKKSNFDADASLAGAHLMSAKSGTCYNFLSTLQSFTHHVHRSEENMKVPQTNLVQGFAEWMTQSFQVTAFMSRLTSKASTLIDKTLSTADARFMFTVRAGLFHYVEDQLSRFGRDLLDRNRGVLHYVIDESLADIYQSASWLIPLPHKVRLLRILLSHGADPNACYGGESAWHLALARCYRSAPEDTALWGHILKLFLWHNADPESVIRHNGETSQQTPLSVVVAKLVMDGHKVLPSGDSLLIDDWIYVDFVPADDTTIGAFHRLSPLGQELAALLRAQSSVPPSSFPRSRRANDLWESVTGTLRSNSDM